MSLRPYTDSLESNIKVRVFKSTLNESELKWHRDENKRYIKIVSGHNWKIQLEDNFPFTLIEGKTYFINSQKWHRLIKGQGDLTIKIKEI